MVMKLSINQILIFIFFISIILYYSIQIKFRGILRWMMKKLENIGMKMRKIGQNLPEWDMIDVEI